MTDYNDGKWHGWNGGECPVDLDAEIEIRWADPKECANNHSGRAGQWDARCWNDPPLFGQIIAFRVTKPAPPKPREGYVIRQVFYETLEEFWEAHGPGASHIHVREVLE